MRGRTTSWYETGAFKASASSCAFSLTLPLRSRKFLIASLTLRLGRCVCTPGMRPFSRTIWLDFRAGHLYLSAMACVGVISTGLATWCKCPFALASSKEGNLSYSLDGCGGIECSEGDL